MAWITREDKPVLLKATVSGKDGYVVLPEGEDGGDDLTFTSREALVQWANELARVVASADSAESYDDWYNG